MIAPPYALLLLGVITPKSLGLSEIDWVQNLGTAGVVAVGALIFLCLGWWSYRRFRPPDPHRIGPGTRSLSLPRLTGVAEALALQAHWGFYRIVVAEQIGLEDAHWGVWAGMGVVALEWALNPLLRRALIQPPRSEPIVRRAVLAIVTTALFILSRNFWLCWALHALFEVVAQDSQRAAAYP
jgi:hypothetical protein